MERQIVLTEEQLRQLIASAVAKATVGNSQANSAPIFTGNCQVEARLYNPEKRSYEFIVRNPSGGYFKAYKSSRATDFFLGKTKELPPELNGHKEPEVEAPAKPKASKKAGKAKGFVIE